MKLDVMFYVKDDMELMMEKIYYIMKKVLNGLKQKK